MCKAAIVTGATGFLGSHLVAGILSEDADVTVICLARPKLGRTAWDRVVHAVRRAYRDWNGHDEPVGWAERVIVIEHDLSADRVRPDGVAEVAGRLFEIGEFWHCAAAVEFAGERGALSGGRTLMGSETIWRSPIGSAPGCSITSASHMSPASSPAGSRKPWTRARAPTTTPTRRVNTPASILSPVNAG
jgi:hypothetical protein